MVLEVQKTGPWCSRLALPRGSVEGWAQDLVAVIVRRRGVDRPEHGLVPLGSADERPVDAHDLSFSHGHPDAAPVPVDLTPAKDEAPLQGETRDLVRSHPVEVEPLVDGEQALKRDDHRCPTAWADEAERVLRPVDMDDVRLEVTHDFLARLVHVRESEAAPPPGDRPADPRASLLSEHPIVRDAVRGERGEGRGAGARDRQVEVVTIGEGLPQRLHPGGRSHASGRPQVRRDRRRHD